MQTYSNLMRKKMHLEEALKNIDAALAHDDYAKPFKHELKNQLKSGEFEHLTLKNILDNCENRKLGFDPDLTIQLIEEEVHNQFKGVVVEAIKARPIAMLMEAKHELELFMLKERKQMYTKGLADTDTELKKIDDALNADPHENLPVADDKLVDAVRTIEAAAPEILTDKEIKKVLKVPANKKTTTKKK